MNGLEARNIQEEVDQFIKASTADLDAAQATYVVSVLLNRAATELHRLAKAEAAAKKGAPDWGRWAALQNNARTLVLQSSTSRDVAAGLAGRGR